MNKSNRFTPFTACFEETLDLTKDQQDRMVALLTDQHNAIIADSIIALTPHQKDQIADELDELLKAQK